MFTFVSTVIFITAFIIWKRDTSLNFYIKMLMLAMSIWGTYTAAQTF